jgi:hypothetical protein
VPEPRAARREWLSGYFTHDYAILAQSVAITFINAIGIYRWLVWNERIGPQALSKNN